MTVVKKVNRKAMKITFSGRSSDFISPSFGYGCLFDCSYCYMKRHLPNGLSIAKNPTHLLTEIDHHSMFEVVDKPNQTDPEYITYDISCNEDFALHAKYHDWKLIFGFFKTHARAKATFATKYVNNDLLEYNPERKVRIRFSLMPQVYSDQLEPETSTIEERLQAVGPFIEAGYDVHLNFSPVIVTDGWLQEYARLFQQVRDLIDYQYWGNVKAEVIFLTHSQGKHEYNLEHALSGEELLWNPDIQEVKQSNNGENNIRYKRQFKNDYISDFKRLHRTIIPWCTIRYIF